MHCWEAQCLDFVDKAFSNGPGCGWVWWLRPEPVPGVRWGWQVSPCWPPAELGTMPASRGMEGAGWQGWSRSSCLRHLSCSRTCWGISSMLSIGEASQQVKNIYVFGWALPGMMCQVQNPAHCWAFCQGQAAQVQQIDELGPSTGKVDTPLPQGSCHSQDSWSVPGVCSARLGTLCRSRILCWSERITLSGLWSYTKVLLSSFCQRQFGSCWAQAQNSTPVPAEVLTGVAWWGGQFYWRNSVRANLF